MGHGRLPFQFELDDADGFVHFGDDIPVVFKLPRSVCFRLEAGAGVVRIDVKRQQSQRDHVDAVAVLQKIVIVVAQADPHGIGDAAGFSPCCAHPQDVVIAPLDVHIALFFQFVHHQVRTFTPVIDVAYDVQLVDDGILDQVADGDDELVRVADVDDGIQDLAVVFFLVEVLAAGGHQFRDDVFKIMREHFPHFGCGIFGGRDAADCHQLFERERVPFPVQDVLLFELFELELRVIDQCGQLPALG